MRLRKQTGVVVIFYASLLGIALNQSYAAIYCTQLALSDRSTAKLVTRTSYDAEGQPHKFIQVPAQAKFPGLGGGWCSDETWQDPTHPEDANSKVQGLIWFHRVADNLNQHGADSFCKSRSAFLPTKGNFHQLGIDLGAVYDAPTEYGSLSTNSQSKYDSDGHDTILGYRDDRNLRNRWFWSSSFDPSGSYYAYGFNGVYGVIDVDFRGDVHSSARCVGR